MNYHIPQNFILLWIFSSNTSMLFLQRIYTILQHRPQINMPILNVFEILMWLIKFNVRKNFLNPGNNSALIDRSLYTWRKTFKALDYFYVNYIA